MELNEEQRATATIVEKAKRTLSISILDHFAGQAMQALIELNDGFPPNCADDAYYIAQEMVVARAKIGLTA